MKSTTIEGLHRLPRNPQVMSGVFHFVGQTAHDVSDNFFDCDCPCVAQRSSDGFDGLPPFVVIALLEIVALIRKLVGQTRYDIADRRALNGGSLRQ